MTPIILTLVAAVSAVAALLGCWLVDRQRYGKTRAKLVKQGERTFAATSLGAETAVPREDLRNLQTANQVDRVP